MEGLSQKLLRMRDLTTLERHNKRKKFLAKTASASGKVINPRAGKTGSLNRKKKLKALAQSSSKETSALYSPDDEDVREISQNFTKINAALNNNNNESFESLDFEDGEDPYASFIPPNNYDRQTYDYKAEIIKEQEKKKKSCQEIDLDDIKIHEYPAKAKTKTKSGCCTIS